jgi:hypothetical protein
MLRHGERPERVGRRGRDGEGTIYKAGRVKVLSHRGDRDCCMPLTVHTGNVLHPTQLAIEFFSSFCASLNVVVVGCRFGRENR